MPSSTVENYLKAILQLDQDDASSASVGSVASSLGVTPGTVSSMMRHLAEQGLIEYEPRRRIALLPAGRSQALQVVRRHRLIETFLVQIMKLDWAEVHSEAEILEHVVSDRLLQRMDEMLGFPSHDPHGDPIPDPDGRFVEHPAQRLCDVAAGCYRILRVDDSDGDFLDWLGSKHLHPGAEIELLESDEASGVLMLRLVNGGETVPLGRPPAASIQVEPR